MCGICGVISADRNEVEPAARRMMQAMVHRGPDDEGYEQLDLGGYDFGPFAGFGFRRLSILDLSPAGHQPMFNPKTGDCLIFNGEIYNFRRLRAELQCSGVIFHGSSDSEVLLQALSTWGEQALTKIQGMYAFAFFDAKTRRVLLARDPLGIKPLYVAESANQLVFASEIRALRASKLVDEELDISGIAGMLAYGAVQSPRTIYRAIRSFPAGHYQWIKADAAAGAVSATPPVRHWQFPSTSSQPVDVLTAAANVNLLLHDAVLRHLVADVPVGVFLSAGIDSTVIASFAREYTPSVTAFTVGFGPVHGEDEVALASETAKALGIKHVTVSLDMSNMPQQWNDWIERMDSPSIDGFNTFAVSRRLAEEDVVVGLSGLGADELFGGYSNFVRGPQLAQLLRVLWLIPPDLRRGLAAGLGSLSGNASTAEKMTDLIAGKPSVRSVAIALRRSLSNNRLAALGVPASSTALGPDYLELDSVGSPNLGSDPFNSVARAELSHYMRDTLLRDTDSNSMQQSLEVRVPFLDLSLVDYVSTLPGRIKRDRGGMSKSLLRLACRNVIRHDLARRPKTGFTLPIGDWMRGDMRDSCEAAIARLKQVPFLEQSEVRRIWDSFLADPQSMHWSRPFSLVVLGSAIQ
ncbi:MAG: asparagine synthase (glutamine-hydrolyzing) [Planctomycetes bacterium]|nr:asparagine synthase (glutamine-hydrolyzing) [Planctomycetota bacterium]